MRIVRIVPLVLALGLAYPFAMPVSADDEPELRTVLDLLPTGGLFAIEYDERGGFSIGPPRPSFQVPMDACPTVTPAQSVCLGPMAGHHHFTTGRFVVGLAGSAASLSPSGETYAMTHVWSHDGTGFGFGCGLSVLGATLSVACRAAGEEIPNNGWYLVGSQGLPSAGALLHYAYQCDGPLCEL